MSTNRIRRAIHRAGVGAILAGAVLAAMSALAQDKAPLRFGLAMPLSGSQALYGNDQVKGALWGVEDINKKGGVAGRKLEMIVLDTQADTQLGINAVNRLISVEKVPIVLTSWSNVVKAVAPIANREKVLVISATANSPEIAHLGDYVYTAFPLADVDIAAVAKYAYKTLGKRTAGVLYVNNESGIEGAKVYRSAFEKEGGKVVVFEAYDLKSTDYTGMLLKLRNANPDMVHIQGLVADLPQVIAQMRQLGLQQRISTYAVGYNVKIIEQLGKAAEGLIVTSLAPGPKDNPRVAEYVERWKTEMGRVPNGLPYTQYLYDEPYIIAALFDWAIKQKLPLTGETMRKALLAIKDFNLPMTGMLRVGEDHRVHKPVYLLTVKDGAFVPLATVD
jgi:branched-chain amino acid transport system substrate-binding protein